MTFLSRLRAGVRSVLQFRVKRWHAAMSGWGEDDIRVLICLKDDVWYWLLLEWLFWDNQTYVCQWMQYVKLPGFVRNWKRVWDKEWDDEPSTFEEYYGDSFHAIWHCAVCDPLNQWVWKHQDKHQPMFEMTLDEARSKFAHDPEIWRWVERNLAEHRQYDAEKAAEEKEAGI
jgi:hypothetical protein